MQDHLKERLTGAAILVIVVVLLVPELLSGPPATNARAGTGTTAGPPVRSYTIDLRDPASAQPPEALAPPPAVAPGPAESPVASAPSVIVPTAPAAPAAPVKAPPPTVVATAPAAVAVAPPATTAPVPSKSPTPATSTHAAKPKGGWTVQVGSFARRDYADRMAKQVTAKGYSVEVAGPDDRGLFRVRSAPLADRAAATALKQKMQASGLKPIVNTVP